MGNLWYINRDDDLIDQLERSIIECEIEIDLYKKRGMKDEVEFYRMVLAQRRASLLQLKSSILLKSDTSLTEQVNKRTARSNKTVDKFDEEAHTKVLMDLKMNEHKMLNKDKYSVKGIGEEDEEQSLPLLPIAPTSKIQYTRSEKIESQNGLY